MYYDKNCVSIRLIYVILRTFRVIIGLLLSPDSTAPFRYRLNVPVKCGVKATNLLISEFLRVCEVHCIVGEHCMFIEYLKTVIYIICVIVFSMFVASNDVCMCERADIIIYIFS